MAKNLPYKLTQSTLIILICISLAGASLVYAASVYSQTEITPTTTDIIETTGTLTKTTTNKESFSFVIIFVSKREEKIFI